ncbi:hypothetical protein PROFUN_00224 [Planoprotostelium fungivorum]|uniref:Cytochrome b5 heme-binding domain-containing protein n=1 Tax=Planoprotostelium fungivorum TaxID=1890364 RepID=A0A2P6NXT8_9EUKA|nr:hypothetical protein PROFUN_00224 [Planoprotostelium fungivorum]
MADKRFTLEEVAKHNTKESFWLVIDGEVYDITKFVDVHPGGAQILYEHAGKDATEIFYGLHRQEVLLKYKRFKIGRVEGAEPQIEMHQPGAISGVPYSEPSFWLGYKSPYFKFRKEVRKFVEEEIKPIAAASEEAGKGPSAELYAKMGAAGFLSARVGPGPWMKFFPAFGVPAEEFDYFHEQIAHEELARLTYPSFSDSLGAGMVIGLPPVFNFGSDALKKKIVPEVLSGKKRICLAITEPFAGSDVANIQATATRTEDGKFFIVNGVKKWITNGTFSDYFSTAVRTEKGITMLLIERGEGVETEQIKTSYSSCAGTAYITFTNVKVPVENILGKDGKGFQVIMYNFNHERWSIISAVVSSNRLVLEECIKWANQRLVFGKKLTSQAIIRFKIANMASKIEACQHWLDNITYQMTNMKYSEQALRLAGPIALLKFLSTRVSTEVSDDACQILGGRGITKGGMGRVIEAHQRTFKYGSILGGSEEIMADLGVRQALRSMPNSRL